MGGMTRLLLFLWAGVAVSSAVDLQKRVFGGADCRDDERLYHVKFVDENDNFFCGGSLVSERWVLTAAHCWVPGMRAVLGSHPAPGRGQPVAIISHETFKKRMFIIFRKKHDIMLVELENPIDTIQPVPLPNEQDCNNKPTIGADVQIAGYGSAQIGPYGEKVIGESPTLQCADFTIVPNVNIRSCLLKKFSRGKWIFRDSHRRDTNPGDSGGGVVAPNGRIYGVHVFAVNGEYACVAPGAFMDVCEYMPWINGVINRP